jgi:hypothetical protein
MNTLLAVTHVRGNVSANLVTMDRTATGNANPATMATVADSNAGVGRVKSVIS